MQYCSQCKNLYPTEMQFCPRHGTPLERRDELTTGMVVREKYEILEELGSGGMGTVFRVKDLDFAYGRNQSAMKVPSAQLAADPEFVRRFRDEAAKARVLNHPNVVRIEHIDRMDSGTPFLVMELVEGCSLRWWMQREPRLSWQTSVEIAKEIALALEAAHAAGLVHCDIKPENVMTVTKTAPLPLKVTDFGLAKATDVLLEKMTRVQTGTSWGTGLVVGTPEYMSPEQARGREHVGPSSDVYSLGAMLFEMLTGRMPYSRLDSVEGARHAHEQRQPASLRGCADLPAELIVLVEEMLDLLAERRPAAATAVKRLEQLLAPKTVAAEPARQRGTISEGGRKTVAEGASASSAGTATRQGDLRAERPAQQKKEDVAIAEPGGAVGTDACSWIAYIERATALKTNGQLKKAIAEYQDALNLHSDPSEKEKAYTALGVALLIDAKSKGARAAFEGALRLNSNCEAALLGRKLALSEVRCEKYMKVSWGCVVFCVFSAPFEARQFFPYDAWKYFEITALCVFGVIWFAAFCYLATRKYFAWDGYISWDGNVFGGLNDSWREASRVDHLLLFAGILLSSLVMLAMSIGFAFLSNIAWRYFEGWR